MNGHLQLNQDVTLRRIDYEDKVSFVADFGPASDASVDVVGETVIVVADGEQHEAELPVSGDPEAFIRNGLLTIEVDR